MKGTAHIILTAIVVLALGACSVQYVSTYSPEIDADASKLREEVAAFGKRMARLAGRPAADPAAEPNRVLFDTWLAKLDAMAARSAALAPSAASCAEFLASLAPIWRQTAFRAQLEGVAAAAAIPDGSVPGVRQDCQTLVISRARAQLVAMQDRYEEVCAPTSPAGRCRSQFQRALPGDTGPGIAIQPFLEDLDTILWMQAAKKSRA